MPTVTFRKLLLRGFGLYRDEACFEFHPGANVLVATNESGKSTLALGIAAVLFGLSSGTDPQGMTGARFRNWHEPAAFGGELWFESDSVLYHIRRDFEDNSVVVRCLLTKDEWAELQRGVHNPRANKPNAAYIAFLVEKLGLESFEVFRKTFFLEQPLPSGALLDHTIEHLLSGGVVNVRSALKSLTDALKDITLDWGAYSRNLKAGRTPRRLDLLRSYRKELEQQVRVESKDSIELGVLLQELSALTRERGQVEAALARAEASLQAFQRWLALRDRYASERQRVREIEAAMQQVRELSEQCQKLREDKRTRRLPGLQGHYKELEELQEQLRQFEGWSVLGPYPLETVAAAHMWVSERLRQRDELKALGIGGKRENARLTQLRLQLETMRSGIEQKYGFSPESLTMELLQEKKTLEETLNILNAQWQRTRNAKVSRRWWYAACGLLAGATAFLVIGGLPGVVLGVILMVVGTTATYLSTRPSFIRNMQEERSITEKQLEQLAQRHPVGKLSYESLPLLEHDIDSYGRLVAEVNAMSNAQQELQEQAEEKLLQYEQQLKTALHEDCSLELQRPAGFMAVLSLVPTGVSFTPSLLRDLGELRQKAAEFVRCRDSLQDITFTIERIEAEADIALAEKEGVQRQLLAAYGAQSLSDLNEVHALQAGQLQITLKDWRSLVEENPGLPSVEESRDGSAVALSKHQLEQQAHRLAERLQTLEQEIFEKRSRQGQLEGRATHNVAASEDCIVELKAEEQALEREAQALGLAIDELEAAATEFQRNHRQALAEASTRHFQHITRTPRRIAVGEDMTVSVIDEDGQSINPTELSQGAQDQLYLSLRLAIADLSANDKKLPFILDDPFLTSDEERLSRIQVALLGLNRQSILLTHNQKLSGWGKPVVVK